MKKDTPFIVTEWNWFKLKLDLYTLLYAGSERKTRFNYLDSGKLVCLIWSTTVERLINEGADKQEQLSFYEDWVEAEKASIAEILQELPVLRNEFDVDRDVSYEVLQDYGMGSSLVCEFNSQGISWHGYKLS